MGLFGERHAGYDLAVELCWYEIKMYSPSQIRMAVVGYRVVVVEWVDSIESTLGWADREVIAH